VKRAIGLTKKNPKSHTRASGRGKRVSRLLTSGERTKGTSRKLTAHDDRWSQDIATLRRAAEELAQRRQRGLAPRRVPDYRFREMAELLDDQSADTRKNAMRELYELDPDRAATLVNDALRDGTAEERRNIGAALADSGLLFEAIDDLMAENHERCYGAFSLLFLVAKAGVVQPLISVIEKHPSLDLRLAVIRLLASSKEPQVVSALQRLSNNSSLAPEVRTAILKAIGQITGQLAETTSSAA
jgi:HEAT repeat protein